MDFLRQIVGGPKNRFKQDGYNLDLTYITSRIIAMAFPASGIQKLYRNSVDSIKQLLENSHQNKYITINISGRSIQEGKLKNVSTYDWQDHKTPSFHILFTICQQVTAFLIADSQRVSVFHCNHGKGRTGTIICCFLMYIGIFKDSESVMKFYSERRFASKGYGVTQPCQIQYIKYFQKMLQNNASFPRVMGLKSVRFVGKFVGEPYIKVYRMNGKLICYNSKESGQKFNNEYESLLCQLKKQVIIAGDIIIEIKEDRPLGHNLLISYAFNTAFSKQHQVLKARLKELSPLGKQTLSNFGLDFTMEIEIDGICNCGEKKNYKGCGNCKGILKDEEQKWQKIWDCLKFRETIVGRSEQICHGLQNV